MWNLKDGSRREPTVQFRIPHSAFRIRLLPVLSLSQRVAPQLFADKGSNLAFEGGNADEGALEGADVVVRSRYINQRLAAVPMEPSATVAVPDPQSGGVRIWAPLQAPHSARDIYADALADQQIGGLLMWVVGGLALWGAMTVVWFRWSAWEARGEAEVAVPLGAYGNAELGMRNVESKGRFET